jgi:hypothetical protein
MRRLAIIGLVVTVVGAVLAIAFWPLASVSGAQLLAAHSGNNYNGYSPGQRITVHVTVLNVAYAQFFGTSLTRLDIETGNPNATESLFVQGDARSVVSAGQVIFAPAVLQTVLGQQVWEISTPSDIHPSWIVDVVFDGLMVAGVALLAIAAFRPK